MGQRKTFTSEFKREAVQFLESGNWPVSQMARELGIKRNQLYNWQPELKTRGGAAFPGKGMRSQRCDEVSPLKQKLVRVTEEREISKKVAAYFAKELR